MKLNELLIEMTQTTKYIPTIVSTMPRTWRLVKSPRKNIYPKMKTKMVLRFITDLDLPGVVQCFRDNTSHGDIMEIERRASSAYFQQSDASIHRIVSLPWI